MVPVSLARNGLPRFILRRHTTTSISTHSRIGGLIPSPRYFNHEKKEKHSTQQDDLLQSMPQPPIEDSAQPSPQESSLSCCQRLALSCGGSRILLGVSLPLEL